MTIPKKYSILATVNYPDGSFDTPLYDNMTPLMLRGWSTKLLEDEKDATSFVITIVADPDQKMPRS